MKRIVIMGVGNLLFSDEGIGVHAVRALEKKGYPKNVEIHDGGTFGLLSAPMFENADTLILIDAVDANGEAGEVRRYTKDEIMLSTIPVKLSPHQIGIQETLLVTDLRGNCPEEVIFYGVIPASYESSIELTETGQKALKEVIDLVDKEVHSRLNV